MDFGAFLLLAFFGWLIYLAMKRHLRSGQKGPERRAPAGNGKGKAKSFSSADLKAEKHWPGGMELEVAGEAHYRDNIARVAGNKGGDHADRECTAFLVPEKGNRHDANAVMVVIDGQHVGYLSRTDAEDFREALKDAGLSGKVTSCNAHIAWGGRGREGSLLHYSIRLDLDFG